MSVDKNKVREIWKQLQRIAYTHNYREFEIAYLIDEMLNNEINSEEEITDQLIDIVKTVCNGVDSLLNEFVYDEMVNIGRNIEESREMGEED